MSVDGLFWHHCLWGSCLVLPSLINFYTTIIKHEMSGSAGPNPLLLTAPGAAELTARLCATLLPCSLRNCPHPTISSTRLLCGISAISLQPDSQLITIDIAKSSQYSLYILSYHCGYHCLNPSPTQSIPPLLPNLLSKAV